MDDRGKGKSWTRGFSHNFMNISEIKLFIKEYGYLFWWIKASEKENINLNAVPYAIHTCFGNERSEFPKRFGWRLGYGFREFAALIPETGALLRVSGIRCAHSRNRRLIVEMKKIKLI